MPDPKDRRQELRHASAAHVHWGPKDAKGLHSEMLRDISSRGMFVVCEGGPEVLTEVRFELLDDEGTVIVRGLGRVVWVQPDVGVGIEFVQVHLGEAEMTRLRSQAGAPPPDIVKLRARRGTSELKVVTIGIDLGTSNTCASIVLEGKPQILLDRYGSNTIPSIVTLDENGAILVGAAAAKRMLLSPETTVYGSKRLIGRVWHEEVAEEFQPYFAYPLAEAEGHRFGADLGQRVMSMEEVARHILGEVRQVASRNLKARVTGAVVTVPAYFTEVQREAVRRAAGSAGLDEIRIISEPTAAALAYGYQRGETARLAVFDLGGGTFDVSVLDVKDNAFEVVATGGDCFLGGIDFDDFVAAHLLEEFCRAERIELEPDAQQLSRLRVAASEVKHGLSVQSRFSVNLPHFAKVGDRYRELNVSLDRERFEELSAPLVDRMIAITEEVLQSAKIPVHSIHDVLLNGGMTRAPIVQRRVEELFGRRPSRRSNPDEAVALGAALMAQELSGGESKVRLVDVLPLSIGIAGQGRRFMRLLPRQTRLPTERSFLIQTQEDDQATYSLPIFQGERLDAANNDYLGTVVIEDIPPGPKGQAYDLAIALDEEGVLSVTAREERSRTLVPVRLDLLAADGVIASLGPYEGEPEASPSPPRPANPLGRLFSKLRSLFRRTPKRT